MKTKELAGRTLDEWVARCQGEDPAKVRSLPYSRSWRDAGKIIEANGINLGPARGLDGSIVNWTAWIWNQETGRRCERVGETPLIAAMRCFVESKLGTDLPDEPVAERAALVKKVRGLISQCDEIEFQIPGKKKA